MDDVGLVIVLLVVLRYLLYILGTLVLGSWIGTLYYWYLNSLYLGKLGTADLR